MAAIALDSGGRVRAQSLSVGATRIAIRLLGGFRVAVDGVAIPEAAWDRRRPAELVKLLALARDRRLARDEVVDALWPHLAPDAGAAALHKAASQARRILGAGNDTIVIAQSLVALAPQSEVTIDAVELETGAALARDRTDRLRIAAALADVLLPEDRYAAWAEAPRRRLIELRAGLLRAAGAWEALVQLDPTDEDAHRALMRFYADNGEPSAAIRQYRRMRDSLARELGVAPSAESDALYESLCRGPATVAPLTARLPLVGRDVPRARALAVVRAARGGVVWITGEPGLGKTCFAEDLLAEAARAGATTLRGAALDGEDASYAPIVEALDRLLTARPDLAERISERARRVLSILAGGTAAMDAEGLRRQAVLSAVTELVTAAARERTVVLFIDDVHAVDASTAGLLDYLGRMTRLEPVVLVLASRPAMPPHVTPLRASLLGRANTTEIALSPLSRDECAALAAQVRGEALEDPGGVRAEGAGGPRITPDDATTEMLWRRSEGIPLFIEMLASAPDALPSGLSASVEAQLDALDAPVRDLVERIAIAGERFGAEELARGGEHARAACEASLLAPAARGWRFHHGLVREAVLRAIPEERRRALHRERALALAQDGAAAARVARHLVEAGERTAAIPWLLQAAQDDARRAAFQSALSWLELGLAHAEPTVELLALRAELLFATGDPTAAAAFTAAIPRARGTRRERLKLGRVRAHVASGNLEQAMRDIGDVAPPARGASRVHYVVTRGTLDWMRGDIDAAERAVEEASAAASDAGLLGELTEVVMLRGLVAHSAGRFAETVRADLLRGDQSELAAAIHQGHLCVAEAYLYGGRSYADVSALARELREAGERLGARRAVAFGTCLLGEAELLHGDLEEAHKHLAAATALCLELGSTGAAALAMQRQAEALVAAGDRVAARPMLDRALALARTCSMGQRHLLHRVHGTFVAAALDAADALARVEEAELSLRGPDERCFACAITFAVPAAIACADAGDLDRAARYAASADQLACMFWRAGAWYAAVEEARGAIARARGEEAGSHFEKAADLFLEAGHRRDAERCRRAAESAVISVA